MLRKWQSAWKGSMIRLGHYGKAVKTLSLLIDRKLKRQSLSCPGKVWWYMPSLRTIKMKISSTPAKLCKLLFIILVAGSTILLWPWLTLIPRPPSVGDNRHPQNPYAVAIFLADYLKGPSDADHADWYFMGARTIIYQLIHKPSTKLTSTISVVVLVTRNVRQSKRRRLEAEGATVIEVKEVQHSFDIGERRYEHVLTKLRVFDKEVMPYQKVFLMDTDMVITRPIDAIFEDNSSHPIAVNQSRVDTERDIEILPQTFTFAATPEPGDKMHPYPFLDPQRERSYFNVGCFLFSPSREIFHYYMAILKQPHLFGHGFPEQDLNYAHRLDGPMPWSRLQLLMDP